MGADALGEQTGHTSRGVIMGERNWKKAVQDVIDDVNDRIREVLGQIDDLLSPEPELVPVPVDARDRRRYPPGHPGAR